MEYLVKQRNGHLPNRRAQIMNVHRVRAMREQSLAGPPLVLCISEPDPEQNLASQDRTLQCGGMPRNIPFS